ncbi:hypothetical protein [Pantoea sp. Ap-967]|uniref:hypothetical protein n=1 Tax=Pantoea sp. Ap-967 TaxID=2608362 RepID=UPI0014211D6A|nr:hypothetical protein [Pantoea sp. Ap-967]
MSREAGDAVYGTGCAGVRGASRVAAPPLLQGMAARLLCAFKVDQGLATITVID